MNEVRYNLPEVMEQDRFEGLAMIDMWLERLYFRTFLTYDAIGEILDDINCMWQGVNWKGETGVTVRNMLLDARSILGGRE